MMKITFDTQNKQEVAEVLQLLGKHTPESNTNEPEEPKEKKTTPSKARAKKAVEPKSEPQKEEGIKLADLKESAKNAVTRSSREEVKTTIGEFADKLAEVDEADYGKLYKKLQTLGA